MTLEGFEIDNWSCINRLVVQDLPPTGVVVLHGPNGTGKSSIVAALRACLMDKKSTTKALDRGFPKHSSEKPQVRVSFRAAGASWRITKQFGTNKSKLERRDPGGDWKSETTDPTEAHERTRQLTGGCDSKEGLHQLLWLNQAEITLPSPEKFDGNVQSSLRRILGVLQTPLDDHFSVKIREKWSEWFKARSKKGELKLKENSPLARNQQELQEKQSDLAKTDDEFTAVERMMEQNKDLEGELRELDEEIQRQTNLCRQYQEVLDKCRQRLDAHRLAEESENDAESKRADALAKAQARAEADLRLQETEQAAADANRLADEQTRQLQTAEEVLREKRKAATSVRNLAHNVQAKRDAIDLRLRAISLKDKAAEAQKSAEQAEDLQRRIENVERHTIAHPAPDDATLAALSKNREDATRLRAEWDAAAIALVVRPNPGSAAPELTIDGGRLERASGSGPIQRSVRRTAEVVVPGWGRVELQRGSDAANVDDIAARLAALDRAFTETSALYGVSGAESDALEVLRNRLADLRAREPETKRLRTILRQVAPDGSEPLRSEAARLQALAAAAESAESDGDLPRDVEGLEALSAQLQAEAATFIDQLHDLDEQIVSAEKLIEGDMASAPSGKSKKAAASSVLGFRQQERAAREAAASLTAAASIRREELNGQPDMEVLDLAVRAAEIALGNSRAALIGAQLTDEEKAIPDRLAAANESLKAIQHQRQEVQKEFHELKGALGQKDGLHQKRSSAAARVDQLLLAIDRDDLESKSYNRLVELFEECREKQLGVVLGPIQKRVLRWIDLLDIPGCKGIQFNDQFLPSSLSTMNGAIDLPLDEESKGTIEQIALMARLALGSTLSTFGDPETAVLDDPLTHSDPKRLGMMRAVLRNAAAGDATVTPPAGPLQILVFTCHPGWFRADDARMVDLEKPEYRTRASV